MPPQSGPWIERLKTKGFRFGGIDHFPDVDPHFVVEHFQFVDHRNIHGAIGVFQDLRRLGNFHTRDAHDFYDSVTVHGAGKIAAEGVIAPDHFRNHRRLEVWVTGIFPFGTEGQEILFSSGQSGGVEYGQHIFTSGGRMGRTFENNQLTRAERFGDRMGGPFDVA